IGPLRTTDPALALRAHAALYPLRPVPDSTDRIIARQRPGSPLGGQERAVGWQARIRYALQSVRADLGAIMAGTTRMTLIAAAAAAMMWSALASAHARLVSADPAPNATVSAAQNIHLQFS